MSFSVGFLTVLHVLLCVFMIFVILLQPGKDAGMGAALGGGAATSAFGGRGAVTFLGKVTAFCAVGFFVTSLALSFSNLQSSVAGEDDPAPAPGATLPLGATNPGGSLGTVDGGSGGALTVEQPAGAAPAAPAAAADAG